MSNTRDAAVADNEVIRSLSYVFVVVVGLDTAEVPTLDTGVTLKEGFAVSL